MSPDLGRRAVACKHWRWLPGMRYTTDHWPEGFDRVPDRPERAAFADWMRYPAVPDLSDPATLGCLLALVREAWPGGTATTARFTYYSPERGTYSGWTCAYWRPDDGQCSGGYIQANFDTEAEALVAALEAAP